MVIPIETTVIAILTALILTPIIIISLEIYSKLENYANLDELIGESIL